MALSTASKWRRARVFSQREEKVSDRVEEIYTPEISLKIKADGACAGRRQPAGGGAYREWRADRRAQRKPKASAQ